MVVRAETFSLPQIVALLGAAACRFDIDLLAECGSTNAELLARAGTGAPAGTVVVTERQTAGRGRMGREWIAAAGDSLTFSLLWRFPPGTNPSGLSLAIGVAVARALGKLGAGDTALKWPNDVLRAGRKLGGTLIEMSNTAVVIGIGVNLRLPAAMPAVVREQAVALDAGTNPNSLLATLLTELLPVLDGFAAGGFAALREEWLTRHAWTGQAVRVALHESTVVEGICAGVAEDGALLLENAAGVQRIHAGDVSLRLMEPA